MERVVMSAGKKEKGENIWTWKTYPLNVARLWNLQWRWWDSDLRTPILALWLEYLAASDVVAALLIHLQLFGASVLPIYQHHLKVQCRFVLKGVSIYQFCSHLFGTFIKNPLTPSVLPGTPKSNYGRPLYCKKKKVYKAFIQLVRETVVAKCLILYVTQASIPDASWFASSTAFRFWALCSSSSCGKYQKLVNRK